MDDHDQASAMHDRMAELEHRLQRMERDRSMTNRSRSFMNRVMPPEAVNHFRNAGREQLMGVRALMDHWIHRLDEHQERAPIAREEIPID